MRATPSNSLTTSFAPRRKVQVRVGTRNFDNNEEFLKHMCAGPPFCVRIRQPEVFKVPSGRAHKLATRARRMGSCPRRAQPTHADKCLYPVYFKSNLENIGLGYLTQVRLSIRYTYRTSDRLDKCPQKHKSRRRKMRNRKGAHDWKHSLKLRSRK